MDKRYLDLFNVQEGQLREVLGIALERGGDYADLYFEYTVSNELSLRDGEVNAVSSNIDYGVGIRVVSGDKTGFAFTEQTTLAEMKNAARIAAQIATLPDSVTNIPAAFTHVKGANYSPILSPWEDHTVTEKMGWLTSLNEKVFAKDSRITKVLERLTDSNTKILFYNSLGESFTDERPMAALVLTCVMEDNGRIESSSSSRSFRMGYEFLNEPLLDEMAQEAYDKGVILFQASQPKGGEMPVVMGAGGSGILLHEAIGHAFEADFNRKGTSIFSDKLGKQICDKSINIDELTFYPLNKHTSPEDISGYLKPLQAGESMGVISEAGCPAVADPGADVVAIAQRKNLKVVPLVGPSSIILSVMGSGFNGQSFAFHGYLPIDPSERIKRIKVLEQRIYSENQTQLFIETPYRNNKMMEDIVKNCRPQTKLCIAANITCEDEYIKTKTVKEWQGKLPDLSKIPCIFLIYK